MAAAFVATAFSAAAGGARAGDYHTGETLVCSDCHVMHASVGHGYDGTLAPGPPVAPAPGGPRGWLLKAAGDDLCLSCHDGRTDAPDVLGATALATVRTAGGLSRAGDTGTWAAGNGHSLGSTDAAPGGTWRGTAGLACTDCHDEHGNPAWRNLRPDRGGASALTVSYATSGPWQASKMVVQAQAPHGDPATHYDAANVRYGVEAGKTLAEWCAGCHTSVHGAPGGAGTGGSAAGDRPSTAGDEWLQHPGGGLTLGAVKTNGRIDATHWWQTSGAGAPLSRVPVATAAGTVPADDNQPFCGSCHKAHGATHRKGLLLDDDQTSAREDGARALDTCQQCHAKSVYPSTRHGDPATGVLRVPDEARAECAQCHVQHGSTAGTSNAYALFAPSANPLCATAGCHAGASANRSYQGLASYDAGAHGASGSTLWPGATPPARPAGDARLCVNCHAPHGASDGGGLIPAQAVAREEALCNACHDGAPAASNIQASFARAYRHPLATAGVHSAAEGGDAAAYGATPTNRRHAECADCHDPHLASATTYAPDAGGVLPAGGRLAGASGARAGAAAAGQTRPFTYIAPDVSLYHANGQPGAGTEHDLCYKCHSAWTALPAGRPDLSRLFNPANPSYHPVEAQGKNANIRAGAFAGGWAATSVMRCTDCHGDASGPKGVHGSNYVAILRAPWTTSTSRRTMASNEVCFTCHAYATYADDRASDPVLGESRWNPPAFRRGHAYHVDNRQIACNTCHASHGATQWPHLLYPRPAAQSEGINSFTETATTATCGPSCHNQKTYTTNYAR